VTIFKDNKSCNILFPASRKSFIDLCGDRFLVVGNSKPIGMGSSRDRSSRVIREVVPQGRCDGFHELLQGQH
jgi:hypothetical protein